MSLEIKEIVKKTYTDAVLNESCCNTSCCNDDQDITFSENYSGINGYDENADYGLGCGIPTEFAKIKKGDSVLDLGSGAGNDVFVAQSIVGKNGHVIGVDMTEAMVERANENKTKLGLNNVEFLLGEIEKLPIIDSSIDVVISNCVMNLVPDKNLAYSEVFRVLKLNGHISISDIVLSGELPPKIKTAAQMYAGCISGAMNKVDYLNTIENAGFKNIEVVKERELYLPDEMLLQYITPEELIEYRRSESVISSVTVYAEK